MKSKMGKLARFHEPVAAAKPVEVPAVPRSAATNVLVRLCTS